MKPFTHIKRFLKIVIIGLTFMNSIRANLLNNNLLSMLLIALGVVMLEFNLKQ